MSAVQSLAVKRAVACAFVRFVVEARNMGSSLDWLRSETCRDMKPVFGWRLAKQMSHLMVVYEAERRMSSLQSK